MKEIKPFEKKIWLSSPTMHGDEIKYVEEAYTTNWMSTVGTNINEAEKELCNKVGSKYAVALSSGTSALHLAMKLAGIKQGDKVFCSDMTFAATVNPIVYEGGIPIFIDTEYDTWNMDPIALEKAFEIYPEVKVVVIAHLYGTPGKIDELKEICDKNNAIIIEDAAESLGATYKGKQTGTFGKYNCISFNGNKIITGSSGGMLLTNSEEAAKKVRKWSTQSRESAAWYEHEEIGYNYRMSNVIAGVVRGQIPHLDEHIAQKKAIYERYKEGFKDLPVEMNPMDLSNSVPNYWLSCMIIKPEAMCKQVRSDTDALYISEPGKSCPTQILESLAKYNAEGRPIWKPMHMQPIYRNNAFITINGNGRAQTNAYISGEAKDIGMDIFNRGLCLPSDNKMTVEEQEKIIEIIKSCFDNSIEDAKKNNCKISQNEAQSSVKQDVNDNQIDEYQLIKESFGLYKDFFKRFFDILFSLLLIIILSPLYIIVSILVLINMGWPILFKQQRPGKDEKIFNLYKFRTMTNKKDENGNLLPDELRLNSFGRFLRRTSIDELPELFCILFGKMSFIGPRPLLVKYLPYYTKEEHHRHDVRPGLTGLAQINGRNSLNWEDRFKYDLDYVKNISLKNDVKIALTTIKKVLNKDGILLQAIDDLDVARKVKNG